MRFFRVALLGFVGLIAGLATGYILRGGYYVQWHKLPPSPAPIAEFLTVSSDTLFVRTVDGSVLQCSGLGNQCWTQGQLPANDVKWTEVTKPCDFSSSEFSFLTHPPNNARACIQGDTQFIEARWRETYLMDAEGNVWEWSYTFGGPSLLDEVCGSIICAAAGVLIGLSSLLIRRKKSPV